MILPCYWNLCKLPVRKLFKIHDIYIISQPREPLVYVFILHFPFPGGRESTFFLREDPGWKGPFSSCSLSPSQRSVVLFLREKTQSFLRNLRWRTSFAALKSACCREWATRVSCNWFTYVKMRLWGLVVAISVFVTWLQGTVSILPEFVSIISSELFASIRALGYHCL